MTRTHISVIAFALSAVFASQAMAQDSAVTRDQVRAELAEAMAHGDMLIDEGGQHYNEVYPNNYPGDTGVDKSREQVKAELAEAVREGNILYNESGERLYDVFPRRYASYHPA